MRGREGVAPRPLVAVAVVKGRRQRLDMTNRAAERDWRSSTRVQLAAVRDFGDVNVVQILQALQLTESRRPRRRRMRARRSHGQRQKLREGGRVTILDRPRRARCLQGMDGRVVDASMSCVTGEGWDAAPRASSVQPLPATSCHRISCPCSVPTSTCPTHVARTASGPRRSTTKAGPGHRR